MEYEDPSAIDIQDLYIQQYKKKTKDKEKLKPSDKQKSSDLENNNNS
jgi:hypothetical protein